MARGWWLLAQVKSLDGSLAQPLTEPRVLGGRGGGMSRLRQEPTKLLSEKGSVSVVDRSGYENSYLGPVHDFC